MASPQSVFKNSQEKEMTTILLDTETNGREPQEPIEVAWVELEEGPAFFF